MSWSFQIGDETIAAKDFEGKGHLIAFPKAIGLMLNAIQNFVRATSSTGLSVLAGVKLLTLEAGRAYVNGLEVRLLADDSPGTYLHGYLEDSPDGQIPAYDPATGAARMVVTTVAGPGGSYSSWTMWVMGALREQPEPTPFALDVGGWGADMLTSPEVGLDALYLPRIIPVQGIVSAEPANPADGNFWIVGPAPSGDPSWVAIGVGNIAHRSAGAWVAIAPRAGRDMAFELGVTGGAYGSLYQYWPFAAYGEVVEGVSWHYAGDRHPPARGAIYRFSADAQLGPEHHGAQILLQGSGHTLTLPDASATSGVLGMTVDLIRDDTPGNWDVVVAGGGTFNAQAPGGVAQIQLAPGESMSLKGNNPFTQGFFHWHILSHYQP